MSVSRGPGSVCERSVAMPPQLRTVASVQYSYVS